LRHIAEKNTAMNEPATLAAPAPAPKIGFVSLG